LLTGLAWYDLQSGTFGSEQYSPVNLRKQLDELAGHTRRMTIGYERFIVTSGGSRGSTPEHAHRAIQVLDSYAQEHTVPMLPPQPSSARKLGQVVYLRRLGWYKPGRGHANDAAQHLLADLLKRHPMPSSIRGKLFPGYTASATISP
jgi:hypothetical protein